MWPLGTELEDLSRAVVWLGRSVILDGQHQLQRLVLIAVSEFPYEVHSAGSHCRVYPL
jgi:hypothetical protein